MSLDRLRQVAEAATPGRWLRDGSSDVFSGGCGCTGELVATSRPDMGQLPTEAQSANALHIATFDPPTVLALLDVADTARRAMYGPAHDTRPTDDLADALDRLREVAS